MIEPRELRINNLVVVDNDWVKILELRTVDALIEYDPPVHMPKQQKFWAYKSMMPLPLTAEWLERFGFKKTEFPSSIVGEDEEYYWENEDYPCLFMEVDDDHFAVNMIGFDGDTYIDTVHAFQNFCFAFTGEELTLNP